MKGYAELLSKQSELSLEGGRNVKNAEKKPENKTVIVVELHSERQSESIHTRSSVGGEG